MGTHSTKDRSSRYKKKFIPPMVSAKTTRKSHTKQRSDNFKSLFHTNLMKKKRELEETIGYLESGSKEDITKVAVDSMIDELDRADREMAAQTYYKFLNRKKSELRRINILLERIIHDQDFGMCEECGRRIPEARLLIIPEAVLCVPCQQELEKNESRMNYSNSNHINSHYRDDDLDIDDDSDSIEDAGVVAKPSSEPISLMDMEEIDLGDMPDLPDDDNDKG